MHFSFRVVAPFLFAFMICAAFAAPLAAHDAGDQAQASSEDGHNKHHPNNLIQGPHVEGHIAFLHAELRIMPAQESLWAPVAAAMREDVKNMDEAESHAAGQGRPETAIQYLEKRAAFANLRAQGEDRFLKAFRPFYDTLSDDQKRMADELLMPHAPD